MGAMPCGAASSLHHWASRDVAPGQGCPEPLVPAGLALRSCTLGCSYQDVSGLISLQDYASAFWKQWVVTTIPIFPYKCLRGWVIGNLDTVFMWSPSLYLPWHLKLDKISVCKNRAKIGSYRIYVYFNITVWEEKLEDLMHGLSWPESTSLWFTPAEDLALNHFLPHRWSCSQASWYMSV